MASRLKMAQNMSAREKRGLLPETKSRMARQRKRNNAKEANNG